MDARDHNSAPLVEPLTRREREVLGLLAQGLTAPEIADKLTLAVSSVKWHVQHLYGKLGVNTKRQALHRAADLGLLGAAAATSSAVPPAEAALSHPKHNLPLQVTRFFGREAEIAQLKARLAQHRLVTLAGSGGVGKTRLSLQLAEEVRRDFADGGWLVELAPVTDPALVAQTLAATVGLRDEPGRTILDALIGFLRARQVMVVLDNCEHLLEACAHLAETLLRVCPRLTILATSREPLGIAGEAVCAIPSLPFPTSDAPAQVEHLDG